MPIGVVMQTNLGLPRGYVFTLGGGAISWCSKKQDCIALSTMEVEYVACYLATQDAVCLRSFLQDLVLTPAVNYPIELLCDNTVAIQFVRDPKFHRKTKHIRRHYHFVRNVIKEKEVAIKYVSISRMIVDPLTMPIPIDAFKAHVMSLGHRRTQFLDVSKCIMDMLLIVLNFYEMKNDVFFKCS